MNHQQTEAGSTEGPATLLRPFVRSLQDFFLILKNMTFTYCLPVTFVFVFHLSSLLWSFRNTLHTMLRYSKLWAKIQGLHWKRVKKQPLFKQGWLKLHSTVNYNPRESNIFYCASCVSFKKHVHWVDDQWSEQDRLGKTNIQKISWIQHKVQQGWTACFVLFFPKEHADCYWGATHQTNNLKQDTHIDDLC